MSKLAFTATCKPVKLALAPTSARVSNLCMP